MSNNVILNTIKSTVHAYLPDSRILLFGSRARGNPHIKSDYDLLVVTQHTFPPREKMNWESKISKALVYSLRAPFDVILQSQEEMDVKSNSRGYIVYYALKDAIEI